ncbi:hypothetical protein [Shewanella gelidii]|uniref:Uncharacterized protein n=1 Tax=Shewanella gelidii TaxID=1642821 RepID=A0A917JTI2_9GAMM|nr:hypothetical protein [Shewanella gelidii]MCL1098069.1 hypothetical protein [Shewanella gelidii]GGI85903.1 hypothetical protein GCM10009332_24020 [Shewanella gelidii]
MFGTVAGAQSVLPKAQVMMEKPSVTNFGFMDTINDGMSTGLDWWMKYEQIAAMKDAGTLGRKQMDDTVQAQTPQVIEVQRPVQQQKNLYQQAADGLKVATGSYLGIGLLLLVGVWWISRK